jgi:hypothetical protein
MSVEYPFNTTGFSLRETIEGLLVQCNLCNYSACFGPKARPGEIGTDLLIHWLEFETGPVTPEFAFAPDTWNPAEESWIDYERRIKSEFIASLEESHTRRISAVEGQRLVS